MQIFKRSVVALSLLLIATPCFAEESSFHTILKDAVYGGLSGSLVGAVVMVFAKKPLDHLDLIGYGAAGGVLVGAAYGTVVASRSLVEVDKGGVKFAMPTIMPEFREPNSKGQSAFVAMAELIRGKF